MKTCIATGLFLMVASAAFAGATYDMNSTANGVSEPQIRQNARGHLVLSLSTALTPDVTDGAHLYSGMSGTCTGQLVINAPSAQGAGICAYSSPAGDTSLVQYSISGMTSDGGFHGTWVSLGGTGRMAGAIGGGAWVNSAVAEDGTFTQQLTGAITLP